DARRNEVMRVRIEGFLRLAARTSLALALASWMLGAWVGSIHAEPPRDGGQPPQVKAKAAKSDGQPSKPPAPKLGLVFDDPRAFRGYTLFAPLASATTYLLDMQGKVVRTWESDCSPASCAFLLDNGHLLRPGSLGAEAQAFGGGPGVGGRIQEFTWEGE